MYWSSSVFHALPYISIIFNHTICAISYTSAELDMWILRAFLGTTPKGFSVLTCRRAVYLGPGLSLQQSLFYVHDLCENAKSQQVSRFHGVTG